MFEGFGVELEYMIVDRDTLDVRPITDKVLEDVAGERVSDVEFDGIGWSNELALHVIELKTNGPAESLTGLADAFHENIARVNELLNRHRARLMPTGMHPWMDPLRELKLWPHDYKEVYAAYHRIFDCQGHGWANLQSVHLNLPFADDAEFGRLHAAIRLLLPILPALAASSPIIEGQPTEWLDTRLEVYRTNAKRIPSIIGRVIPEPVFTQTDYDEQIFQPMYRDIAASDPEGLLQQEFLNSRGAIARFSRNAIEIRVLDVQECPNADVAICAFIVEVLKLLTAERWTSLADQQAWEVGPLESLFLASIRDGQKTPVNDPDYLALFGLDETCSCTLRHLWRHLFHIVCEESPTFREQFSETIQHVITQGTLAARIVSALDGDSSPARLKDVYRELCDCLGENRQFGC
ncbi:MAG: hypothetical protein KDA84_02790 [Planctomycetaceae bacterium]|nr:hypothetical protein [Planctomycetaceae bacterium]